MIQLYQRMTPSFGQRHHLSKVRFCVWRCYDQDLVALWKSTLRPHHMDLSSYHHHCLYDQHHRGFLENPPHCWHHCVAGWRYLRLQTLLGSQLRRTWEDGVRRIVPGRIYQFSDLRRCQVSDQSNLENDDSFMVHIIICVSQHETNWSHLVMLVDVENLMI